MEQHYIYLILLSLLTVACQPSPSVSDQNIVTAHKMFEAFNQHQWELMASYYADSALFLDPSLGKAYIRQSQKDIAAKYMALQQAFPDINDSITALYSSGEHVIVEFTSTGTVNDSISFTLPIITVLSFHNGKIIRDATYYDQENP